MKVDDLFFWQVWSVQRRQRAFQLGVVAWIALWVALYSMTSMMSTDIEDQIGVLRERYHKVAPLAREVLALQSQKGSLASLTPLAAAQQVGRDLQLDENLASIRPMQLGGGQEGVQLLFEALNLDQFLDLLQALRSRGNLRIVSLSLNHRMDNAELADLQLVLSR